MIDAFRSNDVPGWETVRIASQGSVATTEPSVHLWFVNDPFDEEFVSDFTLALKNLRDRINKVSGSVA